MNTSAATPAPASAPTLTFALGRLLYMFIDTRSLHIYLAAVVGVHVEPEAADECLPVEPAHAGVDVPDVEPLEEVRIVQALEHLALAADDANHVVHHPHGVRAGAVVEEAADAPILV